MATVIGQSAQAAPVQVSLQADPPQAVSVHWLAEVVLALAVAVPPAQQPLSWHSFASQHAAPEVQAAVPVVQPWQSFASQQPESAVQALVALVQLWQAVV